MPHLFPAKDSETAGETDQDPSNAYIAFCRDAIAELCAIVCRHLARSRFDEFQTSIRPLQSSLLELSAASKGHSTSN